MTDLDRTPEADAYREAYTSQIRARLLVDGASTIDSDGPLHRKTPLTGRGFITYTGLDGIAGDQLDALIARQCEHFGGLGLSVEWKTHGMDPEGLTERLAAAGFVPEDRETLIVGEAAKLAVEPRMPEGVRIREVRERADLEKIAAMQEAVWGYDCSWMVDALARDLSEVGDPAVVIVAETEAGEVVCAAWVRFHEGTEFTSFWGGSTLAEWRGKGIYKAMVAYRARLAVARGYKYVQVDASDDSMPILRRLGLLAVETTTPYVWKP